MIVSSHNRRPFYRAALLRQHVAAPRTMLEPIRSYRKPRWMLCGFLIRTGRQGRGEQARHLIRQKGPVRRHAVDSDTVWVQPGWV